MTDSTTMSPAEAAERLGKTEDWVLNGLRTGRLPGRKLGRTWRMTEEDVAEVIGYFAVPATYRSDPAGLTPTSRRRLNQRRRSA